jgi:hypothetical protein
MPLCRLLVDLGWTSATVTDGGEGDAGRAAADHAGITVERQAATSDVLIATVGEHPTPRPAYLTPL